MKTETLIKFYNDNEIETVKDYLNTVINNIKETSKLVYKYLMYLVAILFIYYLLQESTLTSVKFGVVDITDLKVIKIFIPPIFAVVYLIVFVGEYRREHFGYFGPNCARLFGFIAPVISVQTAPLP